MTATPVVSSAARCRATGFGTGAALPRDRLLLRWGTPVRVVFGHPSRSSSPATSAPRSTVRAAAEQQLRAGLVDHLRRTTSEALT